MGALQRLADSVTARDVLSGPVGSEFPPAGPSLIMQDREVRAVPFRQPVD